MRIGTRVVVVLASAVGVVLFGVSAPAASATTVTFTTPGSNSWIVPANTSSASFNATGAGGGNAVVGASTTIVGGRGGTTVGTLDVAPSTEYTLRIGSRGEDSNATPGTPGEGGAFGGGNGAHVGTCGTFDCSGAGGGGTAIVSLGLPSNQANVLLLGAGGGGAGFNMNPMTTGGDGGGLVGQAGGTDGSCTAATGGNQDGSTGSGQYIDGGAGQGEAGGGGGGGWRGGAGGAAAGTGEGCGGGGGSGHLAAIVRGGSFPVASNTGDASIAITYFTLTVTVSGQGSVSGTGISCGGAQTDCTESFAPGDTVSLTATPASGMKFDGFSGACGGLTCQVEVAGDGTIEAAFSPPAVPETTITKKPKKLKAKKRANATFEFSSSVAGSTFACSLDGAAPAPCTSPASFKVKKGHHTFSVTASAAGQRDPSPATASFTVKKKKRKH